MIENGASWPQHFAEDADVFNKNPSTNEETGKLLGFKKILKFCVKKTTRGREYKRSWVMEEYRLPSKWNPKQDPVI
ncbi:hypothetical protein F2Q70_00005155 [Brassica cretica]|uniref:NAC domain-containing protein n=1 Tax=Brassica cretica TaxID=69181 RepID=A0A8S9IVJ1_BRACR|nr:hypothetical protein F2Q70_00005155 [Brassica cretica]